ncbi:MAG: carbon-nitrogen hydrolase family protein [Armatimonadota bacterium]
MPRTARLTTVSWGPSAPEGSADPVDSNVAQAIETIDMAAQDGGDLIVLSEAFAHRNMPKPEALQRAEPIPGPITGRIGEAARRHGCYVVAGMYERAGENVHNAAVLIDRQGEVAGVYRKMFPTPGEIENGIMPGTEAPVIETDFGRVGMAICWDLHFPWEIGSQMAEQDVQLICWPSMYAGGFQLRMWAYLFGAYVVSAWPGQVCEIIDMNGYGLAATNYGYPIVSADVNFERDIFMRCTASGKWHEIREAYGDRITMELMHAQGTFSITSEDDDLTVAEVAEAFELDRRVPYYAHCRQVREDALGR